MPVASGSDPAAVLAAAQALARGDLVALPTETVYGLAARADDDAAVARIFAAKGRPADHPLIVHVSDAAAAQRFAARWPASAQRLAQAFWPGPLTLIVPRAPGQADAAAGGQDSVGLRCPSHPVARALLAQCAAVGVAGLAAPSANRFGRISPTTAAHVVQEFGDTLQVLDGGACEVGIESSIVDCTREPPVLLRPGRITRADLERVLGAPLGERDGHSPRASGTLASHYAPRAPLRLMGATELQQALQALPRGGQGLAVYSRSLAVPSAVALQRRMPGDAREAAHELFSVLRGFDDQGAQLIWVEQPPDEAAWDGVADRLRRAATR
ncbi:Sua5/YciO/YrdC/YwlC family protein [Burkholderiales bacterium JOSHI_001]|nr:Sua5/YciO/YrdC/YwlC family protein [Burkholderiales bacterium JOSHI_001]